jgi:RNA polymerase sigma-70 factor (ECF subfamily)
MEQPQGRHTSATLLGRLRLQPGDPAAWADFVNRYGPRIQQWCRARGLQPADAEDVTQAVLLKLLDKMRTFVYDPAQSFRAWLKTVTHNALSNYLRSGRRQTAAGGDPAAVLETVEARDGLERQLEEEFDRELLEEAMARVRLRVAPARWDAFRLTALEGLSGADAATRLGILVATVYTARSKVQKLLQEEVRKLESLEGVTPEGGP